MKTISRRHFTALVAGCVVATGCRRRRSLDLIRTFGTHPSPSGSLVLRVVRKEQSLVEIQVSLSAGGTPLFTSDRIGSDAMRWFLYWESDTSLWAYGSDAGYFTRIDFTVSSTPVENPVSVGSALPRLVWEALSSSVQEKYRIAP